MDLFLIKITTVKDYKMGTATAILASAVIGAGASVYEGNQQKKAAQDAENQRRAADRVNQARIDQVNKDTRPDQQSAGQIDFGSNTSGITGSTNDFLIPASGSKQNSLGSSSSGRSGLGFA